MKGIKGMSKRFGLLAKGTKALLLLVVLQAQVCRGWSTSGTAGCMAMKMNVDQYREHIENQKDISVPDEKNRNGFYATVKHNEPEKVKIILERFVEDKKSGFLHKNADFINAPDPKSGNTPLTEAIQQGNKKICDIFIEFKSAVNLNKEDKDGTRPILTACQKRGAPNKYIASRLIEQPETNLTCTDPKSGNNILHFAVANKWTEIARKLIYKLDPKELFNKNNNGETFLHTLACVNDLELFTKLLPQLIKLSGVDEVIKQFFSTTKDGKTVWSSIYLSAFIHKKGTQPIWSDKNTKIFRYVIKTVKNGLKLEDWNHILKDIKNHEGTTWVGWFKGDIGKQYADTLIQIVTEERK
ncbi:MAG: ankyrin repeat domain-containing protein [Candidatus Cardinium sp.]|uniref:ankyrin repeat domain-containing protein n=1 Tax=Candidatus Cardinium sp. TP TaxID=2961955 RepID=UPI0021AFFBEB|nr:ankyrin repeat domain-containing protein [Candidatus Cardinium sp. TP]MCT4697036.1 ankyrin repeat domain-containing protein [Candidatus Cardinium sp. TP]MDN5247452.1 ankyrin repeat domain-containing protein [Candidatus Cardinium sp.]